MGSPGGPTQKKTIMRSPGGPTQKKNKKIFLVVVAHQFYPCVQIQPILSDRQNS
jgi:hypothetical protein